MLSETPATTAICLCPLAVVALPTISGGNSECICRGSLSSLIFHSSFMSLTLPVVRIVSFCCQAVRRESAPSVSQFAGACAVRGDRPTVTTHTAKPTALRSLVRRIGLSLLLQLECDVAQFELHRRSAVE